MSLVLNHGTEPVGLEVQTVGIGQMANKVLLGGYIISLDDFLLMAQYVLTNTDLKPNDHRIEFVRQVKSMVTVPGYTDNSLRLSFGGPYQVKESTKNEPVKKFSVVVQKWLESERGWGSRPDGFSLHLNEQNRINFIEDYWDTMPNGCAPEEYSRPDGTPYLADVPEDIYNEIKASKNGIRKFDQLPGSGGTDGWKPVKN